MSESSVTLPIVVEDRAALAELKKIQKELGNAGLSSAKLNKQVEDAMKNMAKTTAKAYGDMGMSLQGLKNKFTEFNSALSIAGKAFDFAKQAVELANFGAEMRRLQAAIPVDRLTKLREETKGTVSDFELLKKAAKEMGLSATAGMDEQALALKRGLADWSNFVDQAKASIGGLISTAIVGIVDLSTAIGNAISGEEQLRRTARLAAENAATRARLAQGWAAFDAAKAPELNDRTKQYFEQEAAQTLGIGKVFPKGVSDFVKNYKPPKQRSGGRGGSDGGDAWGALLRPTSNYGADLVRGGMDTLGAWSQSGNGVGDVFSRLGSAIGGIGGGLGDAYSGAAGGERDALAAKADKLKAFNDQLRDQTTAVGAAYSTLSSGIAAGVEAAISGSDNIARAAAKASAASLKAIAIEASVKALFSTAQGLFTGSPSYFAAAAKYAATAVAAGVGSAALGSMAGSAGGASSGASPGGNAANAVPTASQSVAAGPQTIIVNIGSSVLAMDKGQLGETVVKAIDAGKRAGRVRSDREVSVQYE